MVVISVILPIYNSTNTIDECLDNLLQQTLEDIEIICVDDCSTDDSVDKVKSWASKDSRIRTIFHESNQGTLKSRYDGVMNASGKYIMFIDSDDLYYENACLELSNIMDSSDTDMLQFGTEVIADNMSVAKVKGYEYFLKPYCKELFDDEILMAQMTKFSWHVWNRIYTKELCKKAYSAAGDGYQIYSDDIHVSFYLSYYSVRFKGINKKYYKYRVDKGYTGTTDNMNLLRTVCHNSWYIYDCLNFLTKEGKYEKFEKYCIEYPLSEYEHSIRIWRSLKKEEEIEEGYTLLKTTWDKEPYVNMLEKEMSKKYNRIKDIIDRFRFSVKANGFLNTIKLSFWYVFSH